MPVSAAFAIPGDIKTRTGGYIYECRMLETLNAIGQPTRHIELLPSWPHPTETAAQDLAAKLSSLPENIPLILDGLVFGAMDTALLAQQARPIVAMLHHPLGLEAGLPPARAKALLERERDNLRHAAHVVVPSPHTRDILCREFGVARRRISIALPGFDRPVLPASRMKAKPPLVLSVGILCQRKGHDVLLDALSQIADLEWQAAIVGLTHDRDVYEALVRQRAGLGLEERVRFTGVVTQEELDQLYQDATVFALATRYEGYGMVLSEAQLHGLPILSCSVGAVPQTVDANSAILTPPDSPGAFADGLARLLLEPDLRDRLAQGSREAGASLPRWKDAALIMQGVLQQVSFHRK